MPSTTWSPTSRKSCPRPMHCADPAWQIASCPHLVRACPARSRSCRLALLATRRRVGPFAPRLQTLLARSSLPLPFPSSIASCSPLPLLLSLPSLSNRLPSVHTPPRLRVTLQRRLLSVMVAITPLRTLTFAIFGLAASSAIAQTEPPAVVSTTSASGQDVDASSLAAEYHAAGNSTQVPTDIVITSPTSDTVW